MIRVAVVGYGNIGKAVVEAVQTAPDMEMAGVIRRDASAMQPLEIRDIPVTVDCTGLGKVDVAVLCSPSRVVEETAKIYLKQGVATVDSFDIHAEIPSVRQRLDAVAKAGGAVSILSAGWDPGSDSVLRALFRAMAPQGMMDTNFGPGMSMGHSVAARAVKGVKDALSITLPKGGGLHRRMVYVELEDGAVFDEVEKAILQDAYFARDESYVKLVEDVSQLKDMGHGVLLTHKGVSGITHNQQFTFEMRIQNPALTAQVMVSCARAATRQKPGCYTMIELPPIDLLPGERADWVAGLV